MILPQCHSLIQMALTEDLGQRGDVTTAALVPSDARATAHFVNRKPGVVAGLEIIGQVFDALKAQAEIIYHVKDSDAVAPQTKLATVTGNTQKILTAERTALNFISHLSGIATATHELQKKISHTKAKICDTRKTTPGMRELEKYAVQCGGGANHRMGLFDMVMIKDNHIAAVGGDIAMAITKSRLYTGLLAPDLLVAVEVENLLQLRAALGARADRIMLDNMDVNLMAEAVKITNRQAIIEATGGITADNIVAVAETGVDFISSGWITHSSPALDIGLDFVS
jgi:nicotinate-nucleotide pyrophosphorylase (carboxylating)